MKRSNTKNLNQYRLLAAMFLIALASSLYAQSGVTYGIQAKAFYSGHNVVLRWSPDSYVTWMWANQHHGFQVQRLKVKKNDNYLDQDEMLNSKVAIATNLVPVPESDWQMLPDTNLAGIVAGCLYGENVEVIDLANTNFMQVANTNDSRQNRFGFSMFACDQNLAVAQAAGLALTDSDVDPECEYLYIIDFQDQPDVNITVQKGIVNVSTYQDEVLPQIPKPKTQAGNKSAIISWEKQAFKKYYSGYMLERSDDGGNVYHQLNSTPLVSLSNMEQENSMNTYLDSFPDNQKLYYYRVSGVSSFGISGQASDPATVQGVEPPLVDPPHILTATPNGNSLDISWEFPTNMEVNITGFDIFRADEIDGNYNLILSAGHGDRTATDNDPHPANYYVVKAKDVNNHYAGSLPKLGQPGDTTPPDSPIEVTGTCDKAGNVTVSWRPNTEPDLLGYRVFMSEQNIVDSDFVQITSQPVKDTFFRFKVELKTLTKQMYFRVKAVDFRENPSPSSASASVQRADIVPPSEPAISAVMPRPEAVEIHLIKSTSNDVQKYQIQKRSESSPQWVTLAEYDANSIPNSFIDSMSYLDPQSRRDHYQYRVLAIDQDNNVSSSQPIRSKPADKGVRGQVLNATGTLVQTGPGSSLTDKAVRLTWVYPKDNDLVGFQIYRSIDGSQMRSYKFVSLADAYNPNNSTTWAAMDDDINIKAMLVKSSYVKPGITAGTVVTITPTIINKPTVTGPIGSVTLNYQIMAVYIDGGQSALSTQVQVVVQ